VKVSHYSIRSRPDSDGHHPKNWVVEGWIEGTQWIELDRRSERCELVGLSRSVSFSTSGSEFFRKIRLRQTGANSSGSHYLTVGAFELFGEFRVVS
jgi:hypothetical protein